MTTDPVTAPVQDAILSPAFLFRFAAPCRHAATMWPARSARELGDGYELRDFGELEGRRRFATLRLGWNEDGLGCELAVTGRSTRPWCRATRVEDSDGLWLWIDTRDTHNVHRANRFCHRFVFLPAGGGTQLNQPVAYLMPIHRARENPKPLEGNELQVSGTVQDGGYRLRCFIPASALTGFDPQEHARLGFFYAVVDRELGWQTFSVGPEFPFTEDPSLWGTLELVH